MQLDPDLFRKLILRLEAAERSPPEPVFIAIGDFAREFAGDAAMMWSHLDYLAKSGLIDGPGFHGENAFLFRKLTPKGRLLVQAIQDHDDWNAIKTAYGPEST